jgi:hypothetical protein
MVTLKKELAAQNAPIIPAPMVLLETCLPAACVMRVIRAMQAALTQQHEHARSAPKGITKTALVLNQTAALHAAKA